MPVWLFTGISMYLPNAAAFGEAILTLPNTVVLLCDNSFSTIAKLTNKKKAIAFKKKEFVFISKSK